MSQLSLEKWELRVNVTEGIMHIYPPKFQIHQTMMLGSQLAKFKP